MHPGSLFDRRRGHRGAGPRLTLASRAAVGATLGAIEFAARQQAGESCAGQGAGCSSHKNLAICVPGFEDRRRDLDAVPRIVDLDRRHLLYLIRGRDPSGDFRGQVLRRSARASTVLLRIRVRRDAHRCQQSAGQCNCVGVFGHLALQSSWMGHDFAQLLPLIRVRAKKPRYKILRHNHCQCSCNQCSLRHRLPCSLSAGKRGRCRLLYTRSLRRKCCRRLPLLGRSRSKFERRLVVWRPPPGPFSSPLVPTRSGLTCPVSGPPQARRRIDLSREFLPGRSRLQEERRLRKSSTFSSLTPTRLSDCCRMTRTDRSPRLGGLFDASGLK